MIRIRKTKDTSFGLDMAPMINVVFLLLIFFMLTSTAMKHGQKVDLPESQSAEKIKQDTVQVKVYPDGGIEVNGQANDLAGLPAVFAQLAVDKKEPVLEIQADRKASFKICGDVIRLANEAGIREFVFATDQPQAGAKVHTPL
ncbi:putative Biopolymer transport protein ExbD/TolR [Nitrospina gracilis 3/211]|uniref:Putative Biopolymer transport protein ExbD/TolR n=1 Tax=Nitrospina gracilis (strain 3/211) TaxID=1266370 RepID=M1YG20_NITG3|nr:MULTISPECIES: biopolymer transporter ExbD [Nitrospina]MCF8722203.1 biopolymer transport protein ExbD [Nitrospina sp. Nb-3]CCQ89399.1 putative Biopolymer transport protein ExbD/TolR [Nitrospina gracilis 3/211]